MNEPPSRAHKRRLDYQKPLVPEMLTPLSELADIDPQNSPLEAALLGEPAGRGSSNDLPTPEPTPEPAPPEAVPVSKKDGTPLPGGDRQVVLVIRELYAESMRDEAQSRGISLEEHAQQLLDWWIEQEYAAVARP